MTTAVDALPNTELTVVVTDANGATTTLDSNASDPGDIPRGVTFGTQLGHGFNTASFTLTRPIDRDNIDLSLLDDVKFIGANGETAYEGFIASMPRSMDSDGHSITINLAGYMATAADEPFTMVFVDRDQGAWTPAATMRRVDLLSANFGRISDPSVSPDADGRSTLRTTFAGGWALNEFPIAEAWYDAGPRNAIGSVTADWTRGQNVDNTDTNWIWRTMLATDDRGVSFDISANLRAAGPGAGVSLSATTDDRRYAALQLYYTTAAGGDEREYGIDWSQVAVYGNHGLPLLGTSAPYGVAASDVITWLIENYCPLLNAGGVQQTTYPISQLAFKTGTKAFDAFLKVNSYHDWMLGVWEDRTLHYAPIDMNEWDWEIRTDEVGTLVELQGDEYTDLRNGIVVQFTDSATGRVNVLHPDDHAELRDESLENPYNRHGRKGYGEPFEIPFPTTEADALELGRVRMIQDNAPKAPGAFTKQHHIRDRAGNLRPASEMRAGHRVRLTSSVAISDRPRLVGETGYNADSKTVTFSVDSTFRTLDVYLDRVQTALAAANLQ